MKTENYCLPLPFSYIYMCSLMIIKQNEKVDQIYRCRRRSAVCGRFNDVAGNMIVVLGPKWKRQAA